MSGERDTIVNFGSNIVFRPEDHETPADEVALLEIMNRHRGRKLRAYASLHSWSRVAVGEEVAISLRHFQSVEIHTEGTEPYVLVGGGCQIKRLLAELNQQGWTLPSVGLITEQTVAGATSTGTHGSGRNSLSHYIQSARIATYDASGSPVIQDITSGPQLRAARCGLGSLGIIISVVLPIRRQYQVEEHFRKLPSLTDVLAAEQEYPLQQFYMIPWNDKFFSQLRREVDKRRSLTAGLYRLYWSVGMDRGFHLLVLAFARWLPGWMALVYYRLLLPLLVPRRWRVVDRSDRQLTMEHHLFRHIETEIFVRRGHLEPMLDCVKWLLAWTAGARHLPHSDWHDRLRSIGLADELEQLRGMYLHHYPICIRKVLPDDTLISMASGGEEAWYAVSFISYARPHQREGFFAFADLLVKFSTRLFDARPHWGKNLPLPLPEADRLYPHLQEFLSIRQQLDPTEAFLPDWLQSERMT